MAKKLALPPPPPQLGDSQRVALALAGTVPIPSPFPAAGTVSIGFFPPPDGSDSNFEPTFYVRVVHVMNETHIITRYLRPQDIQAYRLVEETSDDGLRLDEVQTGAPVLKIIDDAKKKLRDISPGGPTEILLFEKAAILYVPETAPVLLRLEFGTTAAEPFEKRLGDDGCVCCP